MTFACVKPSLTNSTPPSADFSSLCLSTTLIVTLSLFIGEDLFVADAHLLLVDLPEILSLTGSQGIEKIAWDNSGERLVVSFKGGDDMYKGLITRCFCLFSSCQGIEKITWDNSGERLVVSFKGGDDMYKGLIVIYDTRRTPLISRSLIGFIKGHGDNPKPISFSFHKKFKQGPLLFVC
ncbi:Aladin [Glycine max]|nr:Aladin [Glycine max]